MSNNYFCEGVEKAPQRSLFNALGFTKEEMERPLVGIVSSYNEIVPGHMNIDKIVEAVKMGVAMAGGTPVMFPAIAVCDGIAMGHQGMKYSLVTRDLIADSTECMALAHHFDALVMIPNCDKNVPGLLMAAARVNVPTIFVSGGPMLAGRVKGSKTSLSSMFEAVGSYNAGKMTLEDVQEFEDQACPSCGEELVWDGVHLKCPNPDCKDIQIQDLLVWCNNIAPIDGLGDTLKAKFFEEFGITSIEDIYTHNEITIVVRRGAQKSLFADMLSNLLENKVSMISALKALNIPRLGEATADVLSHYPDDIKKLMAGEVPDNLAYKIGNANAESIIIHKDKFKRLNYIKGNLVFNDDSSNTARIKVAITG